MTSIPSLIPTHTQITAEQILRESRALQADDFKAPVVRISDPEELQEYRLSKRKEFEDDVRRVGRWNPTVWVKYAQWEEQQKDFRRARSVWERALDSDHRNVSLWLKYAEMEMRHRFVNHARNVWDRAVGLLPRVDQLWYKYVHMEEMLGNVAGARQVFERWMAWEPDHHGWAAYIKMELRYNEIGRARAIYERYVRCLPEVKSWVRFAKFEMRAGDVGAARACYERASQELGEDALNEELYLKFAEFEALVGEVERARAIYRHGLETLPRSQTAALHRQFVLFEKQQGDREGIEQVLAAERRGEYEAAVRQNPLLYDTWFDYVRLEEALGDAARVRDVYERAVACVPPTPEKRYWRRYIYLWIMYALYEETTARDADRAREVYRACLRLVPHRLFTFAKVWVLAAQLEIRQLRLDAARKVLGTAIGLCPKGKLFRAYIDMELALGAVDRCRTLYAKYLEYDPANAAAWARWAELERGLGEDERARALLELAVGQPALDAPELVWKAHIDHEIERGDREAARRLYERLLARTQHVKVWLSFARFEATPLGALLPVEDEEDEEAADNGAASAAQRAAAREQAAYEAEGGDEGARRRLAAARAVYERGFRTLRERQPEAKEEAAMLLEAWRALEAGDALAPEAERAAAVERVAARMPRRVKRKRPILLEDGSPAGGMEEYYDYVFPDEAAAAPGLKILEAAYRWKRARQEQEGEQVV